jgi:hypothetical protein
MQALLVEWLDSRQPGPAWRFLSDLAPAGAVRCLSIGWVVAETRETLMLAANLGDVGSGEPQACGVIEIPRRAILRTRALGRGLSASAATSGPSSRPATGRKRRASSARPA